MHMNQKTSVSTYLHVAVAATAMAEQQQWRRRRGSTSVGNQEASAREGRRSRTRGGVTNANANRGAVHRNQEAGESGERERGGERTSTRRAWGVGTRAGGYEGGGGGGTGEGE